MGLEIWARRQITRNWARLLPAGARALILARSDAPDWSHLASVTGVEGRYRIARQLVRHPDIVRGVSSFFDPDWYLDRYDIRGSLVEGLLHFLLIGDRLRMQPHPWFDNDYVRRTHGLRARTSALAWFAEQGSVGLSPHPLLDASWYLSQHADVAESRVGAAVHFVRYGLAEGRAPNAYFEPDWYRERYPDVRSSGILPAQHYCLYGAGELRDPGPAFDASFYHSRYPDRQPASGHQHHPLAHFLTVGRATGADTRRRGWPVALLLDTSNRAITAVEGIVDVVVPVYSGLDETRACIDSVLAADNRVHYRLHLSNDASPEPEIRAYLRALKAAHPGIVLVENPANLGFVGTVNAAMHACLAIPGFSQVVLLNSDTVVGDGWLDRLSAHAEDPRVSTVTALSNNATICSYPKFGPNPLPEGFGVNALGALLARVNSGISVEVPTGVGFCMLITALALRKVGLFDEEAFGRGYGEENDFCLRAAKQGFRNLLAMDVLVEHVGEVSFADVSAPGKAQAEIVMRERHPDYPGLVADFCARDPGLPYRLRLTFALWRQADTPVQAVLAHALGGGTERHVRERVKRRGQDSRTIVIRAIEDRPGRVQIQNAHPFDGFNIEVDGVDGPAFSALLKAMNVGHVEIHHSLGFGGFLREGLAIAGVDYDFYVHDYYTVCPQITLSDPDGSYCGEPGVQGCNGCIAQRPVRGASDIQNWRLSHAWLLEGATELIAPSHDCAARISRHFGRLPEVRYHEDFLPAGASEAVRPRSGAQKILVLGTLAVHKGRKAVIAAAAESYRTNSSLHFHLIGDPQGDVPRAAAARLSWTGTYQDADLPGLILRAGADAVLFASPIPETYSYTLTAAMRSGLPIMATAIGALPERLAGYPSHELVDPGIAGPELLARLAAFVERSRRRAAA